MNNPVVAINHPLAMDYAVACIQKGGILVLPTDTVYGIGCSLFHPEGISRLYEIKGRDNAKAIAVLIGDVAQTSQVALNLNPYALRLAEAFWPGGITLVVNKQPTIPPALSALPTVGIRIPNYGFVRDLARRLGPLAVTSANLSGQPSARNLQEVIEQLGDGLDLYIDGGTASASGLSSTVVDCTGAQPVILREGPISAQQILGCWNNESEG